MILKSIYEDIYLSATDLIFRSSVKMGLKTKMNKLYFSIVKFRLILEVRSLLNESTFQKYFIRVYYSHSNFSFHMAFGKTLLSY